MTAQAPKRTWFFRLMMVFTLIQVITCVIPVIDFIQRPLAADALLHSVGMRLFTVFVTVPIAFIISILMLRRVPGNICGLLLIQWATSLATTTIGADSPLLVYSGINVGWIGLWLLPLFFPDGRVFPPRFERSIQLLTVLVLYFANTWIFFQPFTNTVVNGVQLPNPLYVPALAPFQSTVNFLEAISLLFLIVLIVPSIVLRFRVSLPGLRRQIKEIVLIFSAIVVTSMIMGAAGMTTRQALSLTPLEQVSVFCWSMLISLSPFLAVAYAIFHHRLYDIDIIIRRTLIYSILTLSLATIYFGGVVLTQQITHALTGQTSDLAIVLSTLAIAALFNPLRHRIQNVIDRRFFRRKYDAQQTLEAFSVATRDEVDLDKLQAELIGVMQETMQPTKISLWLRTAENSPLPDHSP